MAFTYCTSIWNFFGNTLVLVIYINKRCYLGECDEHIEVNVADAAQLFGLAAHGQPGHAALLVPRVGLEALARAVQALRLTHGAHRPMPEVP